MLQKASCTRCRVPVFAIGWVVKKGWRWWIRKYNKDKCTCVHKEWKPGMDKKEACDGLSWLSSREQVAHIYGKMTGRDSKLGRRTVSSAGDQKQCVMEGEWGCRQENKRGERRPGFVWRLKGSGWMVKKKTSVRESRSLIERWEPVVQEWAGKHSHNFR